MAIFKREKKEEVAPTIPAVASSTTKGRKVQVGVILRPLVTEKSAHLSATSQYVFEVEKSANKVQVGQAIRQMYGFTPVSVNIQNYDGKIVRRGKTSGARKNWKKAIVTLPKGKKIEVYEGV